MLTSAECQKRADQKLADAKRDPQHRRHHRNAAQAWRFLGNQIASCNTTFQRSTPVSIKGALPSERSKGQNIPPPQMGDVRMEELTAHLEMIFRHQGAAYEPSLGRTDLGEIMDRFRAEMTMLIAEHGRPAVNAAMDAMSTDRWPSIAVH
jgi:hypothetical protein